MNPLESPWNAVLAASLRGSALIAAVLAVRWLLRGRLPTQGRHLLWLLVAVRLLLPGAPSAAWSVFNLAWRAPAGAAEEAGWQVRSFVEPAGAARVEQKTAAGAEAVLKKEPWRAADALPWLWAAGVAVQIVLLGCSALAVRRRLAGAAVIGDARFLQLAEECRAQLGLRRRVVFLESAAVAGPAVLGLWRARLVMPPGLSARLADEELRFVLLHELAHVRRHDLAALWLLTAARVLHWFNPLAWLAAHTARGDAELACDATVLRHAQDAAPTAYGAALLRLVQLAPWRPAALPMAGIAERASALKERLARIADYAPGSVRRSLFTALVVLGMGVVFGADEKKDASPAPVSSGKSALPASDGSAPKPQTEPPAWVKGWSVAKVVIPSDGEIKVAYVDLLPPDGRPITLTPGVRTKDGVMLSGVDLVWSPARAVVRLRKGSETAELFADVALISKSDTLKRAAGQVEIEGQFIEVPEAVALALKDPAGNPLFPPQALGKGTKPMPYAQVVSLLKAGDEQTYLADLKKMKGVDVLSAPRVTTKSGQRAVIEIIRELKYPTEWKKDAEKKGLWVPTAYEVRSAGVTLEVEPVIGPDDYTIDLNLVPQVVEHLGWVDVETGRPIKSTPADAKTEPRAWMGMLRPVSYGSGRIRPVFSDRKITVSVSILSGQSVILTGFGETEDTKPFKPKTPGRRLIVIITARQLNDDGR